MKTNFRLVSANETELQKARREFDEVHAEYMNESAFTERGKALKALLAKKRLAVVAAYRTEYPTHIVC